MSRVAAEVGSTANSYQILSRLATGGMAEIFLARGEGVAGVERYCVLKRILRDRASDAQFVRMFLDEARLAAQLQHPNIAQVYDIGKLGDSYFFTMEYVHGETVRTLLQRAQSLRRALPVPCVLTIVAGAAAGLHHAHVRVGVDGRALGIVHRDVSPSNLMVSYEGSVKLVDFGVAKAADRSQETKSGTVKGKISYLSPEQCRGRRVDRRSDLFSLGICLWEMLTTERLYRRATDFENMSAIVSEPPPPPSSRRPDVPRELDELVLRLLAKEPEQRFQTADEVVDALELVAARTGSVLSASGLGRLVRELFGQRPEPWLEIETLNEAGDPVTVTCEPIPGELASAPADPVDRQLAGVVDMRPRSATQSLDDDLPAPEATPSRSPALRTGPIAGPTQLGFDASPGAETPPRVTRPLTAPPIPDLTPAGPATPVLPSGPAGTPFAAAPPRVVPPAVETFTGSSGRVVVQPPMAGRTPPAGTAGLPELAGLAGLAGLERVAPSPPHVDLPTGSPGQHATPGSLASDTLTVSTGQLVISASHALPELDRFTPSSGQVALPAPGAASGPAAAPHPGALVPPGAASGLAAASHPGALVPPGAAQRLSGTLLGLGPSSAQSMSLARMPRPHSGAPVQLPGLPEARRRAAPARSRWPLYAVIGGAALAGSIAMALVMLRGAESAAHAPSSLVARDATQPGAPTVERPGEVLPAAASSAGAPAAKVVSTIPGAAATDAGSGVGNGSAPPPRVPAIAPSSAGAQAAKVVSAAGPTSVANDRVQSTAPLAATSGSPAAGPGAAASAPGRRLPAHGEAGSSAAGAPASTARAPARRDAPGDDISRLYAAGRFDKVVAQCSAGPVPADDAATCLLAACRIHNTAAARRMVLAIPAARRDALSDSCQQLGVDVRRVDCEDDPMACPH